MRESWYYHFLNSVYHKMTAPYWVNVTSKASSDKSTNIIFGNFYVEFDVFHPGGIFFLIFDESCILS